MNRSQRTRAIYLELRRVLGDEFSAGDLLRSAATLVALAETLDLEDEGPARNSRSVFVLSEVDLAMRDGGWRILDFERKNGMALLDELPDNILVVERRIRSFVGRTEWPRIEMVWL